MLETIAGAGDALLQILLLIFSYAFLGGTIKYIDQAYDKGIGSLKAAKPLAVVSGILMGVVMVIDGGFSTAFFLAMLISLVLTKKIDNQSFLVGTISGVATFLVGGSVWGMDILPLPLVVFIIAGIVDELADALAHDRNLGRAAGLLLHYRPFSDIALVALIVATPFDWTYLAPYFAFTLSYLLMGMREEGQVGGSVRGIIRKAGDLRPW
ncbi:MAG TPA: hypothetical protein PLJ11_08685, partial [Methanomassiliicoccales archaeon]|nr:hypothetical protein [Methanomassiliicoccales archaeon]